MKTVTMKKLNDVSTLKRDDVIPYYVDLITSNASVEEVKRVNQLIIKKWSASALLYIKNKAWRQV